MKLSGKNQFSSPPDQVFARLTDPEALRSCMPGCERLEPIGEDRFEIALAVPIPAVKGQYEGTVEIIDKVPPESFRMKIAIEGKSGFVNADVAMQVEPHEEGSVVEYDADAQVGGPVASVGQRVLTGISRRQVQQMMNCLDRGEAPKPSFWARVRAWFKRLFSGRPS